jgi:hypothetical protein
MISGDEFLPGAGRGLGPAAVAIADAVAMADAVAGGKMRSAR